MKIFNIFKNLVVIGLVLVVTGCTHREAATLGAVASRPLGYSIGVTGVFLEEAFYTARDISLANPRHDSDAGAQRRVRSIKHIDKKPYSDNTQFYKAKVNLGSDNNKSIQSIEFQEANEIDSFWQAD